jgi:HAD superfamily hydrolase (TIGR01509 family)
MSGTLKALIFDVDGTLAETEDVHREAFNDAFKAFGLPFAWDRALYRELLGVSGGRERILHHVRTTAPDRLAGVEAALPRIHARKSEIYARMIDDRRARLRPGVERLFEEAASRGLKIALVTTTSIANAEALVIANLELAGLEMIDAIVGGDAITNRKPAPDIYRAALDRLKVPAARCIAFEDSANGLHAALSAGLRTVVTPSVYTRGQDFSGALAHLTDLGDPFEPYEHVAGAGESDRMVTVPVLQRWLDDDDDMRSLLTVSGRPVF